MIDINKFLSLDIDKFKNPYYTDNYVYGCNGQILIKTIPNNLLKYSAIQKPPSEKDKDMEMVKKFEDLLRGEDSKYKPLLLSTILDVLNSITPEKQPVFEYIKCHECDGDGIISCECFDCENKHEKECKKCGGEGKIKGKQIGEKYQDIPVSIDRSINLNWNYLKLITDIMIDFKGEWEVKSEAALAPVYFRHKDKEIDIVVMQLNLKK